MQINFSDLERHPFTQTKRDFIETFKQKGSFHTERKRFCFVETFKQKGQFRDKFVCVLGELIETRWRKKHARKSYDDKRRFLRVIDRSLQPV